MRLRLLIPALICLLTGAAQAQASTEIWLLRQAETRSEATGDYTQHNSDILSDEGMRQAEALSKRLGDRHFDRILISPVATARLTIAPWLKQQGEKAEVWIDLKECCWQQNHRDTAYRDGIAQLKRAVAKLRGYYAGTHKRILIVTHYHAASRIAELLQNDWPRGRYELPNTGLLRLVETGGGRFLLIDSD